MNYFNSSYFIILPYSIRLLSVALSTKNSSNNLIFPSAFIPFYLPTNSAIVQFSISPILLYIRDNSSTVSISPPSQYYSTYATVLVICEATLLEYFKTQYCTLIIKSKLSLGYLLILFLSDDYLIPSTHSVNSFLLTLP